jgi:hypothetical protein
MVGALSDRIIVGTTVAVTAIAARVLYTRFPKQRYVLTAWMTLIGSAGLFLCAAIGLKIVFRRLSDDELIMGIIAMTSMALLGVGLRLHVRLLRDRRPRGR